MRDKVRIALKSFWNRSFW